MNHTEESRNSYLDTLRGIAVVSVVSVHCLQIANSGNFRPQQSDLVNIGQYGVELFFMISGCLMYMLYGNSGVFSVKLFARRRLARIYPLWFVFVVIGSLIAFAKMSPFFGTITNSERFSDNFSFGLSLILGFTFTLWTLAPFWNSVVPGGWSIQCEIYNYLLFALFRKISLRRLIFITAAMNIAFSQILKIDSINELPILSGIFSALNRLNLLNSFSYFLLGVVCYKFYTDLTVRRDYNFLRRTYFIDITAGLMFALSVTLTPIAFGNQIHCILYVSFTIIFCGFVQKIKRANSLFIKLGKYSYSIYFTHFYFLNVIFFIKPRFLLNPNMSVYYSWVLLTLLTLFTTYLIGKLSWKYFESPIKIFFR